jgi:hypothetical protein
MFLFSLMFAIVVRLLFNVVNVFDVKIFGLKF